MENSYSISKHTIERYTRMFNKERRTRCNVVRLVNAYGTRQSVAPPYGPAKVRKITPAFICRALTRNDIEVYGDGQQVSDMVYVRDGALALVKALEKANEGVVFDRAVECGPAVSNTVNEVAEKIIQLAVEYGFPRVGLTHLPMRPGEIPGAKVTADVETLSLVDIKPDELVDLDTGLATTMQWFVEKWLPEYMAGRR
jgi:UDP-glucose 4-epimerase